MASSQQPPQSQPLLQLGLVLVLLLVATQVSSAAPQHQAVTGVPGVVSYQGQVTVNGQPYNGTGYFKFAVVNAAGTTTFWSNDGTAISGNEPITGVTLNVQRGLFTVLLGDTALDGMTQPLNTETFISGERYLRVWFSADNNNYTSLSPDYRIAAVPYALVAQEAVSASNADRLAGQDAAAFALTGHHHNEAYVNDNAAEVSNADVPVDGLSPDRINGVAWTKINDGIASGLDADLLDGQEAAAFALSSHNHDPAYVNDNSGEVDDSDIIPGGLSANSIKGNAWTATNDGSGSGLEADLLDGQHANDLVPPGSMLLGAPDDTRLTASGFQPLGTVNLSVSGFLGTWQSAESTNAPSARFNQTAVWTGSEMIVWGGFNGSAGTSVNTGGRYNPTNKTWAVTSTTNAPQKREIHTAVWSGSEMIVWGGISGSVPLNTGARYNPVTDTWTPMSTLNAPQARQGHVAVWTGSDMIVWGGAAGSTLLNSGSRYNPVTDTWTPISTINAPSARTRHTAVWAGSEMIIWGGQDSGVSLFSGARYSPTTDTWTAISTSNAPQARYAHTAIWAGNEMIIWGGWNGSSFFNTGASYNPVTDTWVATSILSAPQARRDHKAIWTGGEMIIWGGYTNSSYFNTGARYNPVTNSWTTTSATNSPQGRIFFTIVWTGSEMIIWGGFNGTVSINDGGRYTTLLNLYIKP